MQETFKDSFSHGGQGMALDYLVSGKKSVSIFLVSGLKFDGIITAHDAYTINIIDVNNNMQLIFKDKISTISVKE